MHTLGDGDNLITIWKYRDSHGHRHWFQTEEEAREHHSKCMREALESHSYPQPYMLPGDVMKIVFTSAEDIILYLEYLKS